MIKVITVDDEWYNLEEISDLVEKTGFMKVEKKYQNPVKALEEVLEIQPEVAFIDISMPELDGLSLAEKLFDKCPGIVIAFITSWNQYAVQAFDLNAIDYIMKPIKVERFNRMADKIRNEVMTRRLSQSHTLKIRCFGRLETSIGGVPIKWERSKAEELFAYLIMNHDNYVYKNTLIDHFWPEYEPKKALQILQTSICRIRNVLSGLRGKVTLNYSGSKYGLMITDAECDLFEVEEALLSYQAESEQNYFMIEDALQKYNKGFLTQQGYIWTIEKDQEIQKKFIIILKEIVQKYMEEDNCKEHIRYLKHLATLLPYDDDVNYQLIIAHKQCGNDKDAIIHYQWLVQTLKEEYDITPSRLISNLFLE